MRVAIQELKIGEFIAFLEDFYNNHKEVMIERDKTLINNLSEVLFFEVMAKKLKGIVTVEDLLKHLAKGKRIRGIGHNTERLLLFLVAELKDFIFEVKRD